MLFGDGSRILFHISGTDCGATIHLYIENYELNPATYTQDPDDITKPLVHVIAIESKLQEYSDLDNIVFFFFLLLLASLNVFINIHIATWIGFVA